MATAFVSGGYDVLHGAHIELFTRARDLAGQLCVCIPSDRIMWKHKGRLTLPQDHKQRILSHLNCVDRVVLGDDDPVQLNFASWFRKLRPEMLVVTEDDRWPEEKRALCREVGAVYHVISRSPTWPGFSTTSLLRRASHPRVPARVDLAGGWLDVPSLAHHDGRIVNCTVTPFAHPDGPYRPGAGVGGSAAYAIYQGKPGVESELSAGVGWQDPAVLLETGLCCWQSGPRPKLAVKRSGEILRGRMLLLDTGGSHATPDLVERPRFYALIVKAGGIAERGVALNDFSSLVKAVNWSYRAQLEEGMNSVPALAGAVARKYCGAGHGGYALYLFGEQAERDQHLGEGRIAVEPYLRQR